MWGVVKRQGGVGVVTDWEFDEGGGGEAAG